MTKIGKLWTATNLFFRSNAGVKGIIGLLMFESSFDVVRQSGFWTIWYIGITLSAAFYLLRVCRISNKDQRVEPLLKMAIALLFILLCVPLGLTMMSAFLLTFFVISLAAYRIETKN
jgi:multisubunit Na+/H+ antiporter MnhG subunit